MLNMEMFPQTNLAGMELYGALRPSGKSGKRNKNACLDYFVSMKPVINNPFLEDLDGALETYQANEREFILDRTDEFYIFLFDFVKERIFDSLFDEILDELACVTSPRQARDLIKGISDGSLDRSAAHHFPLVNYFLFNPYERFSVLHASDLQHRTDFIVEGDLRSFMRSPEFAEAVRLFCPQNKKQRAFKFTEH